MGAGHAKIDIGHAKMGIGHAKMGIGHAKMDIGHAKMGMGQRPDGYWACQDVHWACPDGHWACQDGKDGNWACPNGHWACQDGQWACQDCRQRLPKTFNSDPGGYKLGVFDEQMASKAFHKLLESKTCETLILMTVPWFLMVSGLPGIPKSMKIIWKSKKILDN